MAVGHVHRNVPNANTAPSASLPVDGVVVQCATTVSSDGRAAPAIYGDLHNCAGWPPSESSSSTVFGSSPCNTMRSKCHERNEHSLPSKARVLPKPSLKTADSLFYTGEMESSKRFGTTIMRPSRTTNSREQAAPEHARKSVSFAEQRSQAQRNVLRPSLALSMAWSSTSLEWRADSRRPYFSLAKYREPFEV